MKGYLKSILDKLELTYLCDNEKFIKLKLDMSFNYNDEYHVFSCYNIHGFFKDSENTWCIQSDSDRDMIDNVYIELLDVMDVLQIIDKIMNDESVMVAVNSNTLKKINENRVSESNILKKFSQFSMTLSHYSK